MAWLKQTIGPFILVALIFFLNPTKVFSEEAFLGETAIAAYSKGKSKTGKSKKYEGVDSWTPYFTWVGNVENQEQKTFIQSTVGIGFLLHELDDLLLPPLLFVNITFDFVSRCEDIINNFLFFIYTIYLLCFLNFYAIPSGLKSIIQLNFIQFFGA